MNIISKPLEIDRILASLMRKYVRYYIATAWASLGSKASKELLTNKKRIKKMVVGTHFYQTHPNFIEKFINSKKVHFILKTNGIYHPKVYLFSNGKDNWECIIGSANFTLSALSKNSEVVVHIKSTDSDGETIYQTLMNTIDDYWGNSAPISRGEYINYSNIWEKNQKKINSLKEKYGRSKTKKPLIKSRFFSLSWDKYFKLIQKDKFHSFQGRIKLLGTVKGYFENCTNYSDLDKIQRREIAGIATENQSNSNIDWGWFGSMLGAGKFQNRINTNNHFISDSLDSIPLQGKINRSDYMNFVNLFKQAFPDGGAGVAIASRLIAMKRPDYFVCIDKQNRPKLCNEFGLPKSVSFEVYWDDIIERIIDSVWWSSEKPKNKAKVQAWQGRAAMIDALFYEEKKA